MERKLKALSKFDSTRQISAPSISRRRLDLALVFDATGSMNPYIDAVKRSLSDLSEEIVGEVPDTRIGTVVYGDHDAAFLVKKQEFTSDTSVVASFIHGAGSAPNSDWPEAVEVGLQAANSLDWRIGGQRALVLVGDAPPHGVVDGRKGNTHYRDEAVALARIGVHVYSVQCGEDSDTERAFKEIASITQGKYLRLSQASDLAYLIVAVCMKEFGLLGTYVRGLEGKRELTSSRIDLARMLTDGSEE